MNKNLIAFIKIWRELYRVLTMNERKQAITVGVTVIACSCFELLGITAILPFVEAIVNPEKVMKYPLVLLICSHFSIKSSNTIMIMIGIGIIILYLLKNVFIIFSNYIQLNFSLNVQKKLSIRMLEAYLNRPYIFFTETNSAEVLRGCLTDPAAFYSVMEYFIGIATELLTILLIGIYLLNTDLFTALSIILLMVFVLFGMIYLFRPIVKKAGNQNMTAQTKRNKSITQIVQGIKEIFVMNKNEEFVDDYKEVAEEFRKCNLKFNLLNACPDRIVEGICVGGIIGIVCVRLLVSAGTMTYFIPQLATFAVAAFKVLPSIGKITTRVNGIMFYRPLQHELYQNMVETGSLDDINCKERTNNNPLVVKFKDDLEIAEDIAQSDYDIVFDNIEWKYNNNTKPVLTNLSLSIHKGDSVGIIGFSGAGKTTFADILLGLYYPQKGRISINNKDISSIPIAWSRLVGYVPQNVFLLDDTVRNNIAFGDKRINDDEIWLALKKAQLFDFIESLPDNLDTVVGERGVKFSGGQRQRIAIARCLYRKPQILVMDEATASLDNETEQAVMEAIEELQGEITLIIVAHRLTTVKHCTRIYEIKEGNAVEKECNIF